jgi:hypothetical protein
MAAALTALGVATPTIEPVGAMQDARSQKIGQQGAEFEQERQAFEQIAVNGLGVMGGKLDGQVDPVAFDQMLGMMGKNPLAAKLKGRPELLPAIVNGSVNVLKSVNDANQYQLAKEKFGLELQQALNKTPDAPDIETLFDENGAEQKVQWDGKEWVPVGGAEAPSDSNGITMTNPDGTTVQIGGKGTNAFDVNEGKRLSTLSGEIAAGGRTGTSAKARLAEMRKLLSNDQVYTGIGGNQVVALQRFLTLFDPAAAEGVKDTETFNSFSKQAALDLMGGSLGAGFSNADRSFVEQQVPNMENTKEGNLQLIDMLTKLAEHKVGIAKFATDYKKAHGNRLDADFEGALAEWAEANPIFGEAPADTTAAGPRANVPEGAQETKLLDGKTYYKIDGEWFEAD